MWNWQMYSGYLNTRHTYLDVELWSPGARPTKHISIEFEIR